MTRTPLRISFVGGGTDFREYYHRREGRVLSTAIDKFIDVVVRTRQAGRYIVKTNQVEVFDRLDDIHHPMIRESIRLSGIQHGLEIVTLSDFHWNGGSGLGSSSALIVGLLHALHLLKGSTVSPETIAQEACRIEIDLLGRPIGKQDQYISTYGGICVIRFREDERVVVENLELPQGTIESLEKSFLLLYTGITRNAEDILEEQREQVEVKRQTLDRMCEQVIPLHDDLRAGRIEGLGETLHQAWLFKRQLAKRITTPEIERMYEAAREVGALGGKICGAGGGGVLLLYCPGDVRNRVREVLRDYQEIPFHLEPRGTRVLLGARDET